MCQGKDKVTTVRRDVICDDYLRIWWANFGSPGAKNDIQIFEHSKIFNDIRTGMWPPFIPDDVNVEGFNLLFFITCVMGFMAR